MEAGNPEEVLTTAMYSIHLLNVCHPHFCKGTGTNPKKDTANVRINVPGTTTDLVRRLVIRVPSCEEDPIREKEKKKAAGDHVSSKELMGSVRGPVTGLLALSCPSNPVFLSEPIIPGSCGPPGAWDECLAILAPLHLGSNWKELIVFDVFRNGGLRGGLPKFKQFFFSFSLFYRVLDRDTHSLSQTRIR